MPSQEISQLHKDAEGSIPNQSKLQIQLQHCNRMMRILSAFRDNDALPLEVEQTFTKLFHDSDHGLHAFKFASKADAISWLHSYKRSLEIDAREQHRVKVFLEAELSNSQKEYGETFTTAELELRTRKLALLQEVGNRYPNSQKTVAAVIEAISSMLEPSVPLSKIKNYISSISFEFDEKKFNLRHLLGEEAASHVFAKLNNPQHTHDSLAMAKQLAISKLLSAEFLTALLIVCELEQKAHAATFYEVTEILNDLHAEANFKQCDAAIQLSELVSSLKSDKKLTIQIKKHVLSTKLLEYLEAEQIDWVFAEEIWNNLEDEDVHAGFSTYEYVASFVGSLSVFSEVDKSKNKSRTYRIAKILSLLTLTLLLQSSIRNTDSNNYSTTTENSPKIGLLSDIFSSYTEIINKVFHTNIPTNPENESVFIPPRTVSTEDFLVEMSESAEQSLEQSKSITENQSEFKLTSLDTSSEFDPGRVSFEGYALTAKQIAWELQNWDELPEYLHTRTSREANDEGSFIMPIPTDTVNGEIKPFVSEDRQKIIVGQLFSIPESWSVIPAPPGMMLVAGEINAPGLDPYPIEVIYDASTGDQFFKVPHTNEFSFLEIQIVGGAEIIFQFAPIEESKSYEQISQRKEYPAVSLDKLPDDLKNYIQELNNSGYSDIEKMQRLQAWFGTCGLYSLNPLDDQAMYAQHAIDAGQITEQDINWAKYLIFYFGPNYEPLGLPLNSQYPRRCAGECNRRNASAFFAFQLLDLQDPAWIFQLESLYALNSNMYSEESTLVRNNQQHMRLVALNTSTGEIVNLDVTGATSTDSKTIEVLSSNQQVTTPPTLPARSEDGTAISQDNYDDFEYYGYEPYAFPEYSFDHSTSLPPDFPIDLNVVRSVDTNPFAVELYPDWFDYINYQFNTDNSSIPWNVTMHKVPSVGNYDSYFTLSPIKVSSKNELIVSFGAYGIPDQTAGIYVRNEAPKRPLESAYSVHISQPTNTIPLILPNYYSTVVYGPSLTVLLNDRPVDFRVEVLKGSSSQTFPIIVIDKTPEALLGATIDVSFIIDTNVSVEVYRDVFTPEDLPSMETAMADFISMGLTPDEAIRLAALIIQYNRKTNTGVIELTPGEIEYIEKIKPGGTDLMKNLALYQTDIFDVMYDHPYHYRYELTSVDAIERTTNRITELFPNILDILKKEPNYLGILFTLFTEKDFGLDEFGNPQYGSIYDFRYAVLGDPLTDTHNWPEAALSKIPIESQVLFTEITDKLNSGEISTLAELIAATPFSELPIDDPDLREIKADMWMIFLYDLHSVIQEESLPITHPIFGSSVSEEIADVTFCQSISSNNRNFYSCLLNSPNPSQLAESIVTDRIARYVHTNNIPSVSSLELNLKTGTFGISRWSASNFFHTSPFSSNADIIHIYYPYNQDRIRSTFPDDQALLVQQLLAEQENYQKWYRAEIVRQLPNNPLVLGMFLSLFTPLALGAWFGLGMVAHSRKWAETKSLAQVGKTKKRKLRAQRTNEILHKLGMKPDTSAELDLSKIHKIHEPLTPTLVAERIRFTELGITSRIEPPFRLLQKIAERKAMPENPWNSYKIPPDYYTQIKLFSETLNEYLLGSSPAGSEQKIISILEQLVQAGTADAPTKLYPITHNALAVSDPIQWQQEFSKNVLHKLQTAEVSLPLINVRLFAEAACKLWQVLISRYELYNKM